MSRGGAIHRAARISMVVVIGGGVLGAGELLMRQLDLPTFDACSVTAAYAIPDPDLGFAAPPNGLVGGYRMNAIGGRGPMLETPKPAGRKRVLFLGDSTCWGVGVAIEQTFASLTVARLTAFEPDTSFDFLIGAFPGYSSYHSEILLNRLLPMGPDLVVFYVGARNDGTRARYFHDSEIPARKARLDTAWHRWRVLRGFEVLRDRLYRSVFRKLRSDTAKARVPPAVFRGNVERMVAAIEKPGIPGLIVIPPISAPFGSRYPVQHEYRRILEEIATAHDLPTVALQRRFVSEPVENVYFEDHYHFSRRGHELAAEEIARAIRENGLLDVASAK